MKVLKIIGILLLLVIVLALVASLILPKTLEVERERVIDAPIEVVWTMVNRLDSQSKWSPWHNLDPDMVAEITGTDGEVGAVQTWSSDHEMVGSGEHELTLVDHENYRMESALLFKEPWEGEATTYIQLEETEDGKTLAKWGYAMETPIFTNLMMTLYNAKGAIAEDYDKGLENLNNLSQALALQAELAPSYEVRTEVRPAMDYLGMKKEIPFDSLTPYFMDAMGKFHPLMAQGVVDSTYPPSALYFYWDEQNNRAVLTAAMVHAGTDVPEGMEIYTMDSGTYLVIDYYGTYDKVNEAHQAMDTYIEKNGYMNAGPAMEEYITDPSKEPDSSKWLTRVVYPVKKQEAQEEAQ